MARPNIRIFSLSLLDVLFCAFGGVIVLSVVFAAIIKYDSPPVDDGEFYLVAEVAYFCGDEQLSSSLIFRDTSGFELEDDAYLTLIDAENKKYLRGKLENNKSLDLYISDKVSRSDFIKSRNCPMSNRSFTLHFKQLGNKELGPTIDTTFDFNRGKQESDAGIEILLSIVNENNKINLKRISE